MQDDKVYIDKKSSFRSYFKSRFSSTRKNGGHKTLHSPSSSDSTNSAVSIPSSPDKPKGSLKSFVRRRLRRSGERSRHSQPRAEDEDDGGSDEEDVVPSLDSSDCKEEEDEEEKAKAYEPESPHVPQDAFTVLRIEEANKSVRRKSSLSLDEAALANSEAEGLSGEVSSHYFYHLEVNLVSGRELVIRDTWGTSDPYVKFKYNKKVVYRSQTVMRSLNPNWRESFVLPLEDVRKPLRVKVMDYDRGSLCDDRMGEAEILPGSLRPNAEEEMQLSLHDRGGGGGYMGFLILRLKLVPQTAEERALYLRKKPVTETTKTSKQEAWDSLVTIVLVDGEGLLAMDDNGFSDPYVKFRLGSEKYRSKSKTKTLTPRWCEQFDLYLYEDVTQLLELSVYDYDVTGRDDFMGRAIVDLSRYERERTHEVSVCLEDGAGRLRLLVTVTCPSETNDVAHVRDNGVARGQLAKQYGFWESFRNLTNVGWLQVKVLRAQGLPSMDVMGKSDPFCVLELVNTRLRTQTEYKTLQPDWGRVLSFTVYDIHSVLEVAVFDEDTDKRSEFIGRIAIPLLKITPGERKWFALKDRKYRGRAKGSILLEFDLVFNNFKAAVRTFNPRKEKYMEPDPKFRIAILRRNIDRVSRILASVRDAAAFVKSCWAWESPPRSLAAFLAFVTCVWTFEVYLLPLTLLCVLVQGWVLSTYRGSSASVQPLEEDSDDEDDDDKNSNDERMSLSRRMKSIQETCTTVQTIVGDVADFGERVKNVFNFTVPWLSGLLVIVLLLVAILLYYIPLRLIVLVWGIHKFTKHLYRKNFVENNEVLDYISRAPSDPELLMYREPRSTEGSTKRKGK